MALLCNFSSVNLYITLTAVNRLVNANIFREKICYFIISEKLHRTNRLDCLHDCLQCFLTTFCDNFHVQSTIYVTQEILLLSKLLLLQNRGISDRCVHTKIHFFYFEISLIYLHASTLQLYEKVINLVFHNKFNWKFLQNLL